MRRLGRSASAAVLPRAALTTFAPAPHATAPLVIVGTQIRFAGLGREAWCDSQSRCAEAHGIDTPGTYAVAPFLRTVARHFNSSLTTALEAGLEDFEAAGEEGLVLCRFDDADTRLVYRTAGMSFWIVRRSAQRMLQNFAPSVGIAEASMKEFAPFFEPTPRPQRNQALRAALMKMCVGGKLKDVTTADVRHEQLWPGDYIPTESEAESAPFRDVNIVVGSSGAGKTAFSQHYLWGKVAASTPDGLSVMLASVSPLKRTPESIQGWLHKTLKVQDVTPDDIQADPCGQPIVDHLFVVLDEYAAPEGPATLRQKAVDLHAALKAAMPCCKQITLCVVGTGLTKEAAAMKSNVCEGNVIKYRIASWSPKHAWRLISRALDNLAAETYRSKNEPRQRGTPVLVVDLSVARYAKAIAALGLGLANPALGEYVGAARALTDDEDDEMSHRAPSTAVSLLTQLWAMPRAALVSVPLLVSAAGSRWNAGAVVPVHVPDTPSEWTIQHWLYMLCRVQRADGVAPTDAQRQYLRRSYAAAVGVLDRRAVLWVEHAAIGCLSLNGLSGAPEWRKRRVAVAILQVASSGFMHPSGKLRAHERTAPASGAVDSVEFCRERFDADTWLALCKDLESLGAEGPLRASASLPTAVPATEAQSKDVPGDLQTDTLATARMWTVTAGAPAGADATAPPRCGEADVVAREWAVSYGMLEQTDADDEGVSSYSAPLVGLLAALGIARIALPEAVTTAERLQQASLVMVAAARFVARCCTTGGEGSGDGGELPDVPFVSAVEPNVFATAPFTMCRNVSSAAGPDGFCETVAVRAFEVCASPADGATTDINVECAKAGVLKPLHVAEMVANGTTASQRRMYCRNFLGRVLPGGALAKLAEVVAPPKPSAFVIVDTRQDTAVEGLVAKHQARCDRDVVFIGRAKAKGWGALIGSARRPTATKSPDELV